MKLNARLMAKLLTQSYDYENFPGAKSDTASVAGNPGCLFKDPEFIALNPTSTPSPGRPAPPRTAPSRSSSAAPPTWSTS